MTPPNATLVNTRKDRIRLSDGSVLEISRSNGKKYTIDRIDFSTTYPGAPVTNVLYVTLPAGESSTLVNALMEIKGTFPNVTFEITPTGQTAPQSDEQLKALFLSARDAAFLNQSTYITNLQPKSANAPNMTSGTMELAIAESGDLTDCCGALTEGIAAISERLREIANNTGPGGTRPLGAAAQSAAARFKTIRSELRGCQGPLAIAPPVVSIS